MTYQVNQLIKNSQAVLQAIEESSRQPKQKKSLERLWNRQDIVNDTGREKSSIQSLIKNLIDQGICPAIEDDQKTEKGQIRGYTLEQLNAFRHYCGTLPQRDLTEDPQIIAAQQFKGGVGKTVTAVTMAQYFASQGYRVLLVDMDSQGSATTTFGYIPDLHVQEQETILPYFRQEQPSLDYAVHPTYWPNLHLIPSNLLVYNLEFELAASMAKAPTSEAALNVFGTLRRGLDTIKNNYDVIILDSPPALGPISMNILSAADSFVVPTPPELYDFSSTAQFFSMVQDVMERVNPNKEYDFIQILASKVMKSRSAHKTFLEYMRAAFGDSMVAADMPHLSEISNAATEFKTVLEDRRPNAKALASIELVCAHIELKVLDQWPSMIKRRERVNAKIELLTNKLEGAK